MVDKKYISLYLFGFFIYGVLVDALAIRRDKIDSIESDNEYSDDIITDLY